MPQQQPVTPNFGNYPGMVPNAGYVGMPNNVNLGCTPLPTQTATCPSRATW